LTIEYISSEELYRTAKYLSRPGWLRFEPGSDHMGFVVDKVALGQVFFEYFSFPCQYSFQRLLHSHHHLSPVAGTIAQ
jgi:hypothetical protein